MMKKTNEIDKLIYVTVKRQNKIAFIMMLQSFILQLYHMLINGGSMQIKILNSIIFICATHENIG